MEYIYNENKIISLKLFKRLILAIFIVFVFEFFFFPAPALASAEYDDDLQEINANSILEAERKAMLNNEQGFKNSFPDSEDKKFKIIGYYSVTAYNSEVGQTDNTPCITANGFNVCKHGIEDTVAVNFLPFGSKIRIPDLFGDQIFIVRDRMNARFQKTFDIWMKDHAEAVKFGVKIAKIELIEP